MIRRLMTNLLAISYLASVLAAAPHSHAAQPSDHDARPHVHFDWAAIFFADPSPPAHHASHHHHHGAHGGHHHSHDEPRPEPVAPIGNTGDHDSTCVYLTDPAHAVLPAGWNVDLSSSYAQEASVAAMFENHCDLQPFGPQWAHAPPDSLVSGYDLILKLRTLRI